MLEGQLIVAQVADLVQSRSSFWTVQRGCSAPQFGRGSAGAWVPDQVAGADEHQIQIASVGCAHDGYSESEQVHSVFHWPVENWCTRCSCSERPAPGPRHRSGVRARRCA